MPKPSPHSLHTARAPSGLTVATVLALALALWSFAFAVSAAPAPWYYWRSKVDGPGCQPRRKVLVVPMR